MKVKAILAHDSGHGDNYHKKVGAVYEVGDDEAARLIELGYVAAVKVKHDKDD